MDLLTLLDEVFRGPAWHGPSVKEALSGVSAARAAWKPDPDRNSIWDLVLHLTHGRHLLIERVNDAASADFPRQLREPWWPVSAQDTSEAAWLADLEMLDEYQDRLLKAIRNASVAQLERTPQGATHCVRDQLYGLAIHDGYHAGQIRLLALWPATCVSPPTPQSYNAEHHSAEASQV